MTPREPASRFRRLLEHRHQGLLNALMARVSLRAAAAIAAGIALAVAIGAFAVNGETGAWVRLGLLVALAVACLGWALRRYLGSAIGFDAFLEQIEQRFPVIRSRLRNALDFERTPATGTSPELMRAVEDEASRHLEGLPLATLRPPLEPRRPALAFALGLALVLGLGLIAPARVTRSWHTLWNPALAAPALRLAVEPGSVRVTPGAALAVRARVWGSPRTPSLALSGGRAPAAAAEGVGPEGERIWRFDLTQLTRDQDYRVRVARIESPSYRISLAGEPVPSSFQIEYRSPAYARLPVQRGAATRGDLSALRGSRAGVEVTFDRDLEALEVTLPGISATRWTPITARRWRGEVPIEREGDYVLHARAAAGTAAYRYRISPLADAPPVIAVRLPTGDLDLPAGQQVPMEVIGQDDLGLSELRLQFRKDPAAPWKTVPLARFADRPREAGVQSRWDASALALLPGEVATFRFELLDDNVVSGPGRALSPTFELRFPSLSELYENIDKRQTNVQKTLEKVADQARELQKSLDKLARQPARQSPESTPAFERSEELKSSLERQQQLGQKIDEASKELKKSLEEASERQAFNEELTRKMQEMQELMEQVQSKEFRDALKRMQEALENLDRRALEQNLPQWKDQNKEMLNQLERTIDLLKELRQEEQLQALARRAEELQARQDELNREHAGAPDRKAQEPSPKERALAEKQAKEAQESEKLGQDAAELAQEMDGNAKDQTEKAADLLASQASPQQKEASKAASEGNRSRAQQSGQKASASLSQAAKQLQEMAQTMESERAGVDLAAVRRAAQDLVSLQRESESNLSSPSPIDQRANKQTDLSEGAARVADSLYALSKQSPFLSPKLGETLGKAISGLANSGRDLGTGNRARGEESGRSGSAALNDAVLQLRETESAMCQNPGTMPGKKPGSMAQQMSQLGEKQSQLNRQTRDVAKRLSQQMQMSAGDQGELQRLAQEQQRMREQLEQIEKDDQARRELLGKLDGAKRDMQQAEEELRGGRSSGQVEEIQQRILSRLLDASRSVNRRDFDPERESKPGEEITRRTAPELPADLLRENDRLRLDLLKAEADRYPARYRAFIEAYLKALNGSRR